MRINGGFNFGKIASTLSNVMDNDYIDIRRQIQGRFVEIASNVPCHVSLRSSDNANVTTQATAPIIQSLRLVMPIDVDIRAKDFCVAKKMSNDGQMIDVYQGFVGQPYTTQSRKKVEMEMNEVGSDTPYTPIPLPPVVGETRLQIFHISLTTGTEISRTIELNVPHDEEFVLTPTEIDGYMFTHAYLDGAKFDGISFVPEESNHSITLFYEALGVNTTLKPFVQSLFRRNDGSFANGWHLYRSIPMQQVDDGTIIVQADRMTHTESRRVLMFGTAENLTTINRIKLFPNGEAKQILGVTQDERGFVLAVTDFDDMVEPWKDAYVTNFYE